MELHKLIKEKREKIGLTQEDVAHRLNVTRQAVQNWENNKRSIPNSLLTQYFKLLKFDAEEILTVFGFLDNNNLRIESIDYSKKGIDEFKYTEGETVLTKFPTLYLGVGKKQDKYTSRVNQLAYVGEASSIIRRTNEHLNAKNDKLNAIKNDADDNKEELYIIGHPKFNKSATLELEQMFMDSLLGDKKFKKIYNGRNNGLSIDFYERNAYRKCIFPEIWNQLEKKDVVSNLEEVRNSALFANSPFKTLSTKQQEAKNIISDKIAQTLSEDNQHEVIKIQGLAGSGKTVLMSQLFYDIWKDPYEVVEAGGKTTHQSSVVLLVRHEQQRRTYEQIAKKLNMGKDAVMDVSTFITKGIKTDVVLVDEAHLLWSGNYGRINKAKWEPDLMALHKLANTLVLIYDPNQLVSARAKIDDNPELLEIVNGKNTLTVNLNEQWRIEANSATLKWIENFAHFSENSMVTPPKDDVYDIRFFEDVSDFRHEIESKNDQFGLSRLVATYDWQYSQGSRPKNNDKYWYVEFGSETLPWNLELPEVQAAQDKQIPWQEIDMSIGEIGSDFTVQGIDLNYVGVILGSSIIWNEETNSLDIDADKSCDHQKIRKINGSYDNEENRKYLKNVVNVLLTRGVHGLYIYAVDEELRRKLRDLNKKL
ncbi:DUF2075 domain-containing protein [Weissella paramesenteroides]|uniref:DNA/RNA helicase domain-containing protein n=2 Tax=Weissella paramesenteroides TaxID=1249 RepID=UPI0023F6EBD4|nr:DNA/RNA helicase domain-containing protein [Weissella paramesenteroides]MDF8374720.1 DUF2075 domain-containing protein [Weissella paramesenteroides]